jgi:hypothetical protein
MKRPPITSEPPEVIAGPAPLAPKPWRIMRPSPDAVTWTCEAYFVTRAEAEAWLDERRRKWRADIARTMLPWCSP